MKISYDSKDLINELSSDILEFGNFNLWAFSHEIEGYRVYTDYDFMNEDVYIDPEDKYIAPSIKLEVGERKEEMKAKDFLELLIKQDSLF